MDKKLLNIVVTGGPCGGKTTVLDELTKLLRSYGYTVFLSREVATELFNDGVRPFGDDKIDLRTFQSLVLDLQIAKENVRRDAAQLCKNDKVAILYDRGILDNRGYIDDATFNEFLVERGITESEILTRYDLVIHLVTAAIGKEEYYTTENNSARTETVEEARIQDAKTLSAWRNHPNLRIVGNDTLFDEKVSKVKNYIRAYIGEEEVLKQERYLINISDIDLNFFSHQMIKEEIEEFVLTYDNTDSEIYSKSSIDGSSYYTCTKNNKNKIKTCRKITKEEYYDYFDKLKGSVLKKFRYNFIDNSERYRLDFFNIDNNSFAILERDVSNANNKDLPKFIKHAINITDSRDYDDDSLFIDYNINNLYRR